MRANPFLFRNASASSGFTLIELIVTIVVVAVSFTGLSVWMLNANAGTAEPIISMRAATLGQAYMEEILSKRFDENTASGGSPRCNEVSQPACSATMGPEGETRDQFDDVDDYHGINEPPTDVLGSLRPNYAGFLVNISVAYAGADFGLSAQDLKKITITVTTPTGNPLIFSAYRGNF